LASSQKKAQRQILSKADWISAAVEVMEQGSVEQVLVERLAPILGVSRGSFYHHFKSRGDLLTAILEHWTHSSTIAVQEHLDQTEPDVSRRLLLYMRLPLKSPRSLRAAELELAILGWARRSDMARKAVARVDNIRIDHISELFATMGFDKTAARQKAHTSYAFLRYIAQRRDLTFDDRLALTDAVHQALIEQKPAISTKKRRP
jgi:AcrR family transcriptional regulator